MSLMWMPAQTTSPPLRTARSAAGTSVADGREDDRGVERLGRRSSEPPAQSRRARGAKSCACASPGAGEGEDPPALPAGDLRDDVRRGAEAVEAEPLGVAGQPQRAVADQAGAEQRRGRDDRRSPSGSGKQKRSSATAYSA